jgi:replicative DNA helicase
VLADLRESGAIEQDADVVMFIYREEVYEPDTEEKGIAKILVRKHRNGPIGEVDLQFHDRYAKFNNLTRERPAGIV